MKLTNEQLAHKFATHTLESLTVMATSLRSIMETGKDLQGNTHPLSVDELRTAFTEDQKKAIERFIGDFSNEIGEPRILVPQR